MDRWARGERNMEEVELADPKYADPAVAASDPTMDPATPPMPDPHYRSRD